MNDQRPTDLLSSLPRTRPHRRSDKRGAEPSGRNASASTEPAGAETKPAAASKPAATPIPKPKPKPARTRATARKTARGSADTRMRQPAQPRGIPSARRAAKRKPAPTTGAELVGTAVQAVGELAEIGVALGARALRNALGRLPRP
jgi:hypothetical protein